MESRLLNNELSGILLVDKPYGETSFKQISKLRRKLGIKKIGHCGTLDPLASGVLVLCINKATRISEYLLNDDKEYIAGIKFGSSTTTDDKEGEIIEISDKLITKDQLNSTLENFKGEIQQIPPQFSAVKIKGKKAYELARKNIAVKISPRKVNIKEIDLLEFDYHKQIAIIKTTCSKGTYIRSLARDIGRELGVFAHLNSLMRTRSGCFYLHSDKSVFIKNIDSEKKEDILDNMISISDSLSQLTSLLVKKGSLDKVKHGQKLFPEDFDWNLSDIKCLDDMDPNSVYTINDAKLSTIAIVDGNLKYKKVLI